MAATTMTEAKPRQLLIARLKREEEEETWISGEELFTEGSSDDEAHTTSQGALSKTRHQLCALQRRISAPPNLYKWQFKESLKESSEPVLQDEPHLTETTRRFSQMEFLSALSEGKLSEEGAKGGKSDDEVEEQEDYMLWRPKRGSIKIPRIELETPPPIRSSEQKVTG